MVQNLLGLHFLCLSDLLRALPASAGTAAKFNPVSGVGHSHHVQFSALSKPKAYFPWPDKERGQYENGFITPTDPPYFYPASCWS